MNLSALASHAALEARAMGAEIDECLTIYGAVMDGREPAAVLRQWQEGRGLVPVAEAVRKSVERVEELRGMRGQPDETLAAQGHEAQNEAAREGVGSANSSLDIPG